MAAAGAAVVIGKLDDVGKRCRFAALRGRRCCLNGDRLRTGDRRIPDAAVNLGHGDRRTDGDGVHQGIFLAGFALEAHGDDLGHVVVGFILPRNLEHKVDGIRTGIAEILDNLEITVVCLAGRLGIDCQRVDPAAVGRIVLLHILFADLGRDREQLRTVEVFIIIRGNTGGKKRSCGTILITGSLIRFLHIDFLGMIRGIFLS